MIDADARGSWRELESKLRPFVASRVSSTADVDDVLQEVLLRVQQGLAQLEDEQRFGPWVYRIARRAIADHRRRRARHPLVDGVSSPELASDEDEGERPEEQEVVRYIAPFVAMLASPYREALTLTELEGLTQKDAAEMLGISLSGMKSRVQRGRILLRQALEACCRIDVDARGRVIDLEPRPDGRLPFGLETRHLLAPRPRPGGRMSTVPQHLAPHPSFWSRAEVADPAAWSTTLSEEERAALELWVAETADHPVAALGALTAPRQGPLAALGRRWRSSLRDGLGFLRVRGITVEDPDLERVTRRFLLLGRLLGAPVPQNLRGELITDVRDIGANPQDPQVRLYTTRAEQEFHTDGADVIGLLCRRSAKSGGESRLVSSGRVVAELQRTEPELYAALFGLFPWRYQEDGVPPILLTRPICTVPYEQEAGARLNTFFIPWYIRRSQELPDAPRLTEVQAAAIRQLEVLANDPRFYVDMVLEPGDLQWLKNAAILHKRTAYEDHPEADRQRHLFRLWLSAPDFDDGDAQLRAGITEELGR